MTSLSQGLHNEGIWPKQQCLNESHQFWDNLCKKKNHTICWSYFLKGGEGGLEQER